MLPVNMAVVPYSLCQYASSSRIEL